MFPLLDLLRLFLGATILAFASYTDWQWRRAPNVLWTVTAIVGGVLLAIEAALDWGAFVAKWPYLVAVPVFAGVVYGLWYVGLIAGGADAKGLMAFGVLLPFPLGLADTIPLWQTPLPGGVVLLMNSLLTFLLIPLSFFVWNIAHGHLRPPHAFLGVKRRAADVRRGHVWPMETVDEAGAMRTRLFASRMSNEEIDATFARVQALGDRKVWVSPKIPFMIPMLVGLLLAFTVGDVMLGGMMRLLPAP